MNVPDVSIVIPAWKAVDFIGRAVASATSSIGVSLEVIVIDDASPDATFDVMKALATADARIVTDRLPVNVGPSAARNRALDLARGRYIAILDADDTMASGRLKSLVALADETGADVIVDNLTEVDEQDCTLGPASFVTSAVFARPREIGLADYVHFNQPLKPVDCLGYLKPLFRRATLERTGLRYDTGLRNSEDYYLVAHLLASGATMRWTPEAGYRYRRSPTSTSHRLKPSQTAAWLIAEREFQQRFKNHFNDAERAELRKRDRRLREVDQFVRAVDAVKARNPIALASVLASEPQATMFTLSKFTGIALGKVTGGIRRR
jgi:succinoglycan biosynthesis protein ExoO